MLIPQTFDEFQLGHYRPYLDAVKGLDGASQVHDVFKAVALKFASTFEQVNAIVEAELPRKTGIAVDKSNPQHRNASAPSNQTPGAGSGAGAGFEQNPFIKQLEGMPAQEVADWMADVLSNSADDDPSNRQENKLKSRLHMTPQMTAQRQKLEAELKQRLRAVPEPVQPRALPRNVMG